MEALLKRHNLDRFIIADMVKRYDLILKYSKSRPHYRAILLALVEDSEEQFDIDLLNAYNSTKKFKEAIEKAVLVRGTQLAGR